LSLPCGECGYRTDVIKTEPYSENVVIRRRQCVHKKCGVYKHPFQTVETRYEEERKHMISQDVMREVRVLIGVLKAFLPGE